MDWRSQFRKFARRRNQAKPRPGNLVFDEFLDAKKHEISKRLGANSPTRGGISARRSVDQKLRGIKTRFKERPKKKIPVDVLAFKRRDSFVIDNLCPSRAQKWLAPLTRARVGASVEVGLTDLSFLNSPEKTLEQISALLRAESAAAEIRVHFDDVKCGDVAPYLLLAMIWRDLTPIFTGGRMTIEIQKVVEAVQLRRPLKMGRFRHVADSWEMRAFPLHRRRAANSSQSLTRYLDPQTREEVQDAFVVAINDWLDQDEIAKELTPEGRGHMKNIIGEILDNAERHSMPATMDGDWTIAGFMARRDDTPGVRFECSIAFISIGATIAQSLDTSPPAVAKAVDAYVAQHKSKVAAEVLRTVMSVQDGITRVPESAMEHRGGTGFQEVLDLVNDLGDANLSGCGPRITIVSGSACLKLHAPYARGIRKPGDIYAPREVWFNSANDSGDPPDPEYAFSLSHSFPGTIVTMSFVFEPSVTDGDENGSD